MSRVLKIPVGVSDQDRHKRGCTATEDWQWPVISDLGSREIICTIYEAKTKALINCTVTAQLICSFVFAHAKGRFSRDAAQTYLFDSVHLQ